MNIPGNKRPVNKGFTLIEIMVVIVILGIILPMIYYFFSGMMDNMVTVTQRTEHLSSIRILLNRMRWEISCCYIPSDPAYVTYFIGKRDRVNKFPRDTLDFMSTAHQWRGGEHESYDITEIGYRLKPRDLLAGDTDLALTRREDVSPDPQVSNGGSEIVMADFIKSIRIRYYNGSRWVEEWDSSVKKGLPLKVKVELVPTKDTGLNRVFQLVIPVQITQKTSVTVKDFFQGFGG